MGPVNSDNELKENENLLLRKYDEIMIRLLFNNMKMLRKNGTE